MAILSEDPKGFTLTQRSRITDALNERFGDVKCEICGSEHWGLNQRPVTPVFLETGPTLEDMKFDFGTTHPCIMIHCSVCGNTKLLSIQTLKIDLSTPEFAPESVAAEAKE